MDMRKRYEAAEKLLPWNVKEAVLNGDPKVQKLDGTHFFYGKQSRDKDGVQVTFMKVSTEDGSEEALFDHAELAEKLGCGKIPFDACTVKNGVMEFVYEDEEYSYDLTEKILEYKGAHQERAVSVSPDGTKEVFVRAYDLWMRNNDSGREVRLTYDGEKDFEYAKIAEYSGYITERVKGIPEKPDVLWSPDSKYFLTYKLDQRNVPDLFILQSYDDEHLESIRPRLHTYKCSFPEDKDLPMAYYCLGNAEEETVTMLDCEPQMSGGRMFTAAYGQARWLDDSSAVYTSLIRRANKSAGFVLITVQGEVTEIVHEEAEDFLNIATWGNLDGFNDYCASNFITDDRKTVFWQSERDDLARLFAYDAETKELKGAVTPADCEVGEIVAKNDASETIWFMASNLKDSSDPYYRKLCSVRYDGSEFRVLTPEDGMHHSVKCNDMIIDTWSRVDCAPVTNLYRADGTYVRELVSADISDLMARGYILPERFTVTASDGETTLYGILIRPADFDETKKYPVIDYIYGGMQCYNVPKAFQSAAAIEGREIMGGLEELAQLGFAGIILDGLGTPGRGKKLHNISYENIHGCAGLKDHVTSLPELAEKFPFLDTERAGIWGNSGGGCATSRAMLEYPDTYKVGVSSAGNHDQRMYNNSWTENYYGAYDREIYLKGDNTSLAKNLKGHLYIVHGAMDDNVAMSQSIRLIDALIKEDKDFDFLILPRTNHNVPANPYFIRRKLDYFVKYLLEEEVPADYRFALPEELK